jgi:N utilization substance protein B
LGSRRKARVLALQVLYQVDLTQDPLADTLEALWEGAEGSDEAHGFAGKLVLGVRAHMSELDALVQRTSEHWRIDRMPLVDRNILRLAIFEFLHCPDIPPRVTINEAVELAKRFGTAESGAFINGVLDQVRLLLAGREPDAGTPQAEGVDGSEDALPREA